MDGAEELGIEQGEKVVPFSRKTANSVTADGRSGGECSTKRADSYQGVSGTTSSPVSVLFYCCCCCCRVCPAL